MHTYSLSQKKYDEIGIHFAVFSSCTPESILLYLLQGDLGICNQVNICCEKNHEREKVSKGL